MRPGHEPSAERLASAIKTVGSPLLDESDLDPLLERVGSARVVLLGEASHGTAEFYEWRARITRRLVEEKGFSFVAVEGDWPDCQQVHHFVTHGGSGPSSAAEALQAFRRWPTWMWANEEVSRFVTWLREHNAAQAPSRRVGFHGLDVYSLWESLDAVVAYLRENAPHAVEDALRAMRCFEPFAQDAEEYARSTVSPLVPRSCEQEAVDLLAALRHQRAQEAGIGSNADAVFEAEQNALVVRNAESYYRAMVRSGPGSWNVRDHHMMQTLDRLLEHHGANARGIVWAHNTHVGDARATDMAGDGLVNIGQLAREGHGRTAVFACGFGSWRGSVIAARAWGSPMERMSVPTAREGSWEDAFHRASPSDQLLLCDRIEHLDEALLPRGHRAIGVVYDPARESWGNYVPSILPDRYDAFIHLDTTRALTPHRMPEAPEELPETFPFGV